MGLLEIASGNSVWRGLDYYENKKVLDYKKDSENIYSGHVSGSNKEIYDVVIDIAHPKKNSSCNCKFAEGRRVVCKHMVALYFTMNPKAADDFLKQMEEWEEEEAAEEEALYSELRDYVWSLSVEELRIQLFDRLLEEEYRKYW